MSAGTITVTNGSTAVTGASTVFTTALKANDVLFFEINGTPYNALIASISSDTSLTLVDKFQGPTKASLPWEAISGRTLARISQEVASKISTALTDSRNALINFNLLLTEDGDVTVTLQNNQQVTGPSWKKVWTQIAGWSNIAAAIKSVVGTKITFLGSNEFLAQQSTYNDVATTPAVNTSVSSPSWESGVRVGGSSFYTRVRFRGQTNIGSTATAVGRFAMLDVIDAGGNAVNWAFGSDGTLGSPNMATTRSSLGFGEAANYNVGRSTTQDANGKLLVGGTTYTSGNNQPLMIYASNNTPAFGASGSGNVMPPLKVSNGNNNSAAAAMCFVRDGAFGVYIGLDAGDNAFSIGGFSYGNTRYRFWHEGITTVDGNGFIKRASPIVRVADTDETEPAGFGDNGFKVHDNCALNDEAAGVTVTHVSEGVYEVHGTAGLASESWQIEIPQDQNGNRLCFVETSFADGVITLRVNKRKFDIDTAMIVAGAPMDVPAGRWIDLRVDMPEDSQWKTFQREMAAQMKADHEAQLAADAAAAEEDANEP